MEARRSRNAWGSRKIAVLALGALAVIVLGLCLQISRRAPSPSADPESGPPAARDAAAGPSVLDSELRTEEVAEEPESAARVAFAGAAESQPPRDSPDNPYQVRGTVRLSNDSSPHFLVDLRMTDDRGNVARVEWTETSFYFGPGLHGGAWTLYVPASPALREFRMPIDLTPEEPVQRRDLVLLRPREIAVRFVTPKGEPLLEALAREKIELPLLPIVTLAPPGAEIEVDALLRRSGEVHSTWRGPGGAPGPPDGDNLDCTGIFYVSHFAELPVFLSAVSGTVVLATRTIHEETSLVEFVIAPPLIRSVLSSAELRVVDSETGRPVDDALAVLGSSETLTDSRGEARFERQTCGWRDLVIVRQGYGTSRSRIRLAPGSTLQLGLFRLHPAVSVSGRVVDREDRPAQAVVVAIHIEDPGAESGEAVANARILESYAASSVDEGSFVFSDLCPGHYALRASSRGTMSETVEVDTTGGPKDGVRLQLRPCGGVELRVPSSVRETYDVSVFDSKSVLVARREGVRATESILLPPGAYSVRTTSSSGASGSNNFEVKTGLHTVYLTW